MNDITELQTEPLSEPLVEVAPFRTDSRFRLVRVRGLGWGPATPQDFELLVRTHFPDIDLDDPRQVRWADEPGQWPR